MASNAEVSTRAGRYIAQPTGYARNRRFRYAPYIALLNDAGPGTVIAEAGS